MWKLGSKLGRKASHCLPAHQWLASSRRRCASFAKIICHLRAPSQLVRLGLGAVVHWIQINLTGMVGAQSSTLAGRRLLAALAWAQPTRLARRPADRWPTCYSLDRTTAARLSNSGVWPEQSSGACRQLIRAQGPARCQQAFLDTFIHSTQLPCPAPPPPIRRPPARQTPPVKGPYLAIKLNESGAQNRAPGKEIRAKFGQIYATAPG